MPVPEPFECPQFATVAPDLCQAGDTGRGCLVVAGGGSSANHTGASSICHLHFFQSTDIIG